MFVDHEPWELICFSKKQNLIIFSASCRHSLLALDLRFVMCVALHASGQQTISLPPIVTIEVTIPVSVVVFFSFFGLSPSFEFGGYTPLLFVVLLGIGVEKTLAVSSLLTLIFGFDLDLSSI